jgi:hypothetical protein
MALKISQLTPVAVNTLTGAEPVELGIAGDKNAPNGAFLPQGHIVGLKMVWVSGTAITVTSGAAYIQSLGRTVRADAAIAKAGLALTASTWYHVYLYLNAGVPDIEIVTTAPGAPYNGTARTKTGDTSRRYIGSVRVNSSAQLHKFTHNAQTGVIKYLVDLNNPDLKLVTSGTSVGADATVSCSSAVPVIANTLSGFAENNDTGSGIVYVSNADVGSPANGNILEFIRASRTLLGDFMLTSAQTLTYMTSSAASFSLYATGYTYER